MGSAAMIPMSFESPKFQAIDPLGASAKAMSLYSAAQGIGLNQQRIAEETLKAKQLQRDQDDHDFSGQVLAKNKGDWLLSRDEIRERVQPKISKQYEQGYAADVQATSAMNLDKARTLNFHIEASAQGAASLLALKDADRPAKVAALRSQFSAAGIDPAQVSYLNSDTPSDDVLNAAIVGSQYMGKILSGNKLLQAAQLAEQQAQRLKQTTEQEDKRNALEEAARTYRQFVTDEDSHAAWLETPEAEKAGYAEDNFPYSPENARRVAEAAMTSKDVVIASHRDEVVAAKAEVDAAKAERDAARTANQYEIATGNLKVAELRAQTAIDNMNRMREPIERKERATQLAMRLLRENTDKKTGKPADIKYAIENATNPANYQGDAEFQDVGGDALMQLRKWQQEGATTEGILARTAKTIATSAGANTLMGLRNVLAGGTPKPASGPPATTPKPTPAAAPPANPKRTTVRMRAPTGQTMDVSPDLVEHYKSKGAVVVGQ